MKPDAEIVRATPEPAAVARRDRTEGTGVAIDGREWTLAAYVPAPGIVWDRLYDQNVIRARYEPLDILHAAVMLLLENYELPIEEAVGVVRAIGPAPLVPAVERALFGLPQREDWRTWSDWVIASCWANAIDPGAVPPDRLPYVLEILERTGRTVPAHEYCTAQVKMGKRQSIVDFHAKQAAATGQIVA